MKNHITKVVFLTILLFASTTLFSQENGVFVDKRDGQEYKWVKIGEQVWFAQNLNYETKKGSWQYEDYYHELVYGRLYNWETANKSCPDGWHLPTDREWSILEYTCGGREVAGIFLKAKSGWTKGGNGQDVFDFSALPGGYYSNSEATFGSIGREGVWWTSTSYSESEVWIRFTKNTYSVFARDYDSKSDGCSVRCIKD